MDYRKIAQKYIDAGYSVIPVNSTKQPAIAQWGLFQLKAMNKEEVDKHFKDCWGMALLCGGQWRVVGLDFDLKYDLTGTLFERFKKQTPKELLKKMYVQTTKNEGFHFVFKAPKSCMLGNKQLASRGTTAYERDVTYRDAFNCTKTRDKATKIAHNDKSRVLIETRSGSETAAGGYVVIAPSPGYEKVYGKILEASEEEFNTLMEISRSYNEVLEYDKNSHPEFKGDWQENPIEHYNREGDVIQLLIDNGWELLPSRATSKNARFLRPGQTDNPSSALFDKERRIMTCYSTSTIFEANKGYSPFGIYAMLEHDNDFLKAFNQLALEGYGTR